MLRRTGGSCSLNKIGRTKHCSVRYNYDIYIYIYIYIYCAIYEWKIKYLLRSSCLSLKVLILEERTSSVGSAFQIVTIRLEKKILRMLFFARGTINLSGWPHRFVFGLRVKKLSNFRQVLCLTMLKHRARSLRLHPRPLSFHRIEISWCLR